MTWPIYSGSVFAGDNTNLTPTVPAHASGDLIMAIAYRESSGGAAGTFTLPAGMTRESSRLAAGSNRWAAVDWKIATSAAESFTWMGSGGTEGHIRLFVIPAGTFDVSDPIGTVVWSDGADTNDGSTVYTLGSYTAPARVPIALYVALAAGDDNQALWRGSPAPAQLLDEAADTFPNDQGWSNGTSNAADMGSYGGVICLLGGETASGLAISGGAHSLGFMLAAVPVRAAADFAGPLTDAWAGTNGADWDKQVWATAEYQDSTSHVNIDNNRGRFEGKNSGGNRVGVFARKHGRLGDFEVITDLVQSANTSGQSLFMWLRGSGGWGASDQVARGADTGNYQPANGVGFRYDNGAVAVVQSVAGVVSDVGSPVDPNLDGSVTIGVRARIVGSQIQVRVWNKSGAEPATWTVDQVVTGAPTAGWFQMARRSTGTTNNGSLYFDNLTITDLFPAADAGNRIGGTGAIRRSPHRP